MTAQFAVAPGHASSMKDVIHRLEHYLGLPGGKQLRALAEDARFDLPRALEECRKGATPGNRYAQPLQFLLGHAAWTTGDEHRDGVHGVVGHSLGEFLAVSIAGSVSWLDTLRLVVRCGTVMDAVHRLRPGAMSALLGFDESEASQLCASVVSDGSGPLEIANINLVDQVVVSGDRRSVEELERRAPTAEGKRIVRLGIAGAAHSSMYAGRDPLQAVLRGVSITAPSMPLYLSTMPQRVSHADGVRQALAGILINRVDWVRTLKTVRAAHPEFSPVLVFPDRGMATMLKRSGHPARPSLSENLSSMPT